MYSIIKTKLKGKIQLAPLILLAINALLFIVLTSLSPTFLTARNISSLMLRMSELSMLAIAQTIVIINGGLDITVGSVMALSGAICGMLIKSGVDPLFAAFGGILGGAVVGTVNSFLVVNLRIQSFVATVATNSIVRSIVYLLLRGNVLSSFPKQFTAIGSTYVGGIPLLFIIVVLTAVAAQTMLRRTALGRSVYSVGANERCSYLSGIMVSKVKYFVFILSGVLAAMGGIMYTMRIGAIIPDAGLNSPLEVVTAALIGGASVRGGKGSIFGSLLGILAMYILLNGFSLLGLNPFWQVILLGVILIAVVGQSNKKKTVKMSRSGRRGLALN